MRPNQSKNTGTGVIEGPLRNRSYTLRIESFQVILSVSVPTLAVLIGILINSSRLSDLRAHMDVRFAGLESLFDQELLRVEQVMDARLTRIEKDLQEMRP
jgi:hypothetical protein